MWQQATASHKNRIIQDINAMEVNGRSNWQVGFNFTFKLIENSLKHVQAKNIFSCKLENIALLFFSDGLFNMPAGSTDDDLVRIVGHHVQKIESKGDFHIHPFFYSLGNSDVGQVAKQIACSSSVDGYWAPISSAIAPGNVTVGYQSLFSTPMGTNAFYNYTSWSAPYTFATSGELGYTVSGLVYNRDVEPPRYMGAVGMDISAEAARQLYGGTMDQTVKALNEIIGNINLEDYNATCEQQRINLTYCETQSMRQLNGGNEAICIPKEIDIAADELEDILPTEVIGGDIELNVTDENITANVTSDFLLGDNTVEDEGPTEDEVKEAIFDSVLNCSKGFIAHCAGYDEYPDDLWRNVNLQGQTYIDRVCCEVGTNDVSNKCPKLDEVRDTKLSDTQIFVIMFVSLALVELVACYFCFYYRKRRNSSR